MVPGMFTSSQQPLSTPSSVRLLIRLPLLVDLVIGPKPERLVAKCGELASHRCEHGRLEDRSDNDGSEDTAQETIDHQARGIIDSRWEEIEDLAVQLVETGEVRQF